MSLMLTYMYYAQKREPESLAARGFANAPPFLLKELAPLLVSQAREISRFRSPLAHAREEKYKTREALVRRYDGRQVVLRLVEDELKAYRRLCQRIQPDGMDSCAGAMMTGFRDEVSSVMEKQGRQPE